MIKFWNSKANQENKPIDKSENVNNTENDDLLNAQPSNNITSSSKTNINDSANSAGNDGTQGPTAKSNLSPPKNLPDLAKDLFGRNTADKNENEGSGYSGQSIKDDNVPSEVNFSNIPSNRRERNTEDLHEQINSLREKIITPPSDDDLKELDPDIVKKLRMERVKGLDFEKYSKNSEPSAGLGERFKGFAQKAFGNDDKSSHSQNAALQFTNYNAPPGSALADLINKMKRYHALKDLMQTDNSARAIELDLLWEFVSKKLAEYESIQRDIEGEALLYAENGNMTANQAIADHKSGTERKIADISTNDTKKKLSLQLMNIRKRDQALYTNVETSHNPIMSVFLADPERFFYLRNGAVLRSIYDMINALMYMDQDTYNAHVNPSRNDFANWIENVFKDVEIAGAVRKYSDKNELIIFLKTLI